MTKETAAHATLKFQGHIPYPHEQKVDDWGLNAEQQARKTCSGVVLCVGARLMQLQGLVDRDRHGAVALAAELLLGVA
jgi:hypothetical protein